MATSSCWCRSERARCSTAGSVRATERSRGCGSGNNRTGRDGGTLTIELPPGTVVKDAGTGDGVIADLVEPGTLWVAARGGRGGRGNARFATPTRQAPRHSEPGEPGEEKWLELELKLIADIGLVGPPNAGKSTLLARITRARPRIAAYAFTTLEPNLGIVELDPERRLVAADLPGLIAGAHEGKGLGHDFLRHVERTRALAFLVDATSPSPEGDLRMIERELHEHSAVLLERPRILVLTKADLFPPEERAGLPERLGMPHALLVSSHSGLGIGRLLEEFWSLAGSPPESEVGEPQG